MKGSMMTKNSRSRPNNQLRGLKAALVIGSLAASVVGTRLVAVKDGEAAAVAPASAAVPAPAAAQPVIIPGPNNSAVQLDLPPIPTVIAPSARPVQPVTRTRSSK